MSYTMSYPGAKFAETRNLSTLETENALIFMLCNGTTEAVRVVGSVAVWK